MFFFIFHLHIVLLCTFSGELHRYNNNGNLETQAELVDDLNSQSWSLRFIKMEKALQLADSAYSISKSIGDSQRLAISLNRKGIVFKNMGKFPEALNCFEEAIPLEIENKNHRREAGCYTILGNIYKAIGDYPLAQEYYLKSLKIIESNFPGTIDQAFTYKNLGHFYYYFRHQYDTALYYLEEAKLIAKDKDDNLFILVENDLGLIYRQQGMYEKAFSTFKNIATKCEMIGDSIGLSRILDNLGLVSINMQKYDDGENYFKNSIGIKERYKDTLGLAIVHANLGDLMLKKGEYQKSISYYEKFLAFSKKTNSENNIKNAYLGLSESYEGLGDFQNAHQYRKIYDEAKDSLFNEVKNQQIEKLRVLYNTEKRKKEIIGLKHQQQLKQQALDQSNLIKNIFMLITGLVIVIALLIVNYYRMKRKASQHLALKIEEINNQRVNDLLKTQELKVMEAAVNSQENERKRIAQQLHGEVGSILHTIKLYFTSLDDKISLALSDKKEQYEKANELLDKVTKEIRDVSHSLDVGIVNNLGIIAALEELVDSIKKSNQIDISLESFNMEERHDARKEILIYRIIQEVISNVLKHANASKLNISLTKRNGELNIMVEDDGVGFDQQDKGFKEGIGLKNISNNVKILNGELVTDSRPGHGTTIIINVNL